MRKHIYIPGFALVLGIAGAFIRATELNRAFEPETGLQIPGESSSVLMAGFTIAAVVLLALTAFLSRGKLRDDLRILTGEKSVPTQVLTASAAVLLVVAAFLEFASSRGTLPVSRVVLLLLALLAAFSIGVRLAKTGREYALFSLIPIFWCCFWLILIYRDRSIDPVVPDYVYELFAVVAMTLLFYGVAGYDFGSRKLASCVFFGLVAIYLCTVTALGPVVAQLRFMVDIANPDTLPYFAGCALYALGGTIWLLDAVNRDSARSAA